MVDVGFKFFFIFRVLRVLYLVFVIILKIGFIILCFVEEESEV